MAEVCNVAIGSNNQALSVSGNLFQVNFTFLDLIKRTDFLRLFVQYLHLATSNFCHAKVK